MNRFRWWISALPMLLVAGCYIAWEAWYVALPALVAVTGILTTIVRLAGLSWRNALFVSLPLSVLITVLGMAFYLLWALGAI